MFDIHALCGRRHASVLSLAIKMRNVDILQLVLQNGANIDSDSLQDVARHGAYRIVKMLLEHGSEANFPEGTYDRLLGTTLKGKYNLKRRMMATKSEDGRHDEVVKILLEHGADVNSWTEQSPLHIAVRNYDNEMVMLLCERGADVNVVCDKSEMTPLFRAAYGRASLGAMRMCNEMKGTDLFRQQELVIRTLLDHGAEVNAVCRFARAWLKDKDGNKVDAGYLTGTPLIAATDGGRLNLIPALLEGGADVHYASEEGTALDIAIRRGGRGPLNHQICQILRDASSRSQLAKQSPVFPEEIN